MHYLNSVGRPIEDHKVKILEMTAKNVPQVKLVRSVSNRSGHDERLL